MKTLAVIDCGSNTFNLLVGSVDEGRLHTIHTERRAVLLQKARTPSGELSGAGCQRAIDTLHELKSIALLHKAEEIHCLATSIFRKATNSKSLQERIFAETGLHLQVISGEEEAAYIFNGIKATEVLQQGDNLIMDIGGGSTEFVLTRSGERCDTWSFEIGATRLLQEITPSDPLSQRDMLRCKSYIRERIQPLIEAVQEFKPTYLVGASGFFDTLSDLAWAKTGFEESLKPASLVMTVPEYLGWRANLLPLTNAERGSLEHIPPFRADLLPMGFCLVDTLLEEFAVQALICSTHALKEGALLKLWSQCEHNYK